MLQRKTIKKNQVAAWIRQQQKIGRTTKPKTH